MHWGVHDHSIQELEDQLFSAILLAQREFNCVRPSDPERQEAAQIISEQLQQARGSQFKMGPLYSGRGHGPFAEMIDGSVKYDLIGGIGPYLLGHSHPLQIRAQLNAARCSILNSTNFLPLSHSALTAQKLIDAARPSDLKHCWFSSSGSMANDSALRMLLLKRSPRRRLIVFEHSFAGRTLGMQSITLPNSNAYELEIDTICFPIDETSAQLAQQQLAEIFAKYPDAHAAFHGELIQGEGGVHLPYQPGLKQIFARLKQAQIPIWIDEVQTFARTHQLFAFQHFGLQDFVDVCTIGKAFNLAAVLYTSEFALAEGLGGTFQGGSAALDFAQQLLRLLTQGQILGENGRNARLEKDIYNLFANVQKATTHFPLTFRGVGTIWGVSLNKGEVEFVQAAITQLFDKGIIAWRAGRKVFSLRFLFPLTITEKHLTDIQDIMITTFKGLRPET